jgi:hypothetical protein
MPRLAEGKEGSSYLPATGSCRELSACLRRGLFGNILMLEPFAFCYTPPYRSSEVPFGFPPIFPAW